MYKKIGNIKKFRLFLLNEIDGLTTEQLNFIPLGCNNNIIWNIGHLTAAMQSLCYKRSGLPIKIDENYFSPFLTGTKPDRVYSSVEIEVLKKMFIHSVDTLQEDLSSNIFFNYTKPERIEQVYGVALSTIDEALDFLFYHEGVHCGCICTLKRLV